MSLFTTALRRLAAFAAAGAFATAACAVDIVEYYNASLDHYFITGYGPEIRALDGAPAGGWSRTGYTFQVFDAGDARGANGIPVCRFYGSPARGLDSHFYSATALECDEVQRRFGESWLLESPDFFRVHAVDATTGACPSNTKAVYRLYNRRSDVNHRYTTEAAIVDAMLVKGYALEGNGSASRPIAFCAANIAPATPVAGAPLCTLASSTSMPFVGGQVTLTATCTGSPVSYAWVNCTSTTSTCTTTSSIAGSVNYSVVATNGSGAGQPAALTLDWGAAAAAAPICTVSASTTTPPIGSALTLNANCSQTPTRYEWLGCSALVVDICNPISECRTSTTTCSPVGQQVGAVFYALRATNSAGTSGKSGVAVTWGTSAGTPPPPPPPVTPTPFCTISASPSSPAVNTQLTLTASCTNNPTSYQWSNCTSATNVCRTTETAAVIRNYGVTASNASGTGSPASVNVAWQQPPTAPPVCTLSANNPTPYVGSTVTLTASCTQSPTSFSWVGCTSTGSTCVASSANTGSINYSVSASNQFGAGSSASTSVTWQTAPAAGADFCGNEPNVVRLDLPWGGHTDTLGNGGFPADAVLVLRLRVPANAVGSTTPGSVSAVEYVDPQTRRLMTISPSACDFRGFQPGNWPPPSDATGARNPMAWSADINPSIQFSLTSMPGGGVKLAPGGTYYVNLRNRSYIDGSNSCQGGTCNMRITVNRPN
jgi:hypothetical protein